MILLDNYFVKCMSTNRCGYHYRTTSSIIGDKYSVSSNNYTCSYTDDTWFSNYEYGIKK